MPCRTHQYTAKAHIKILTARTARGDTHHPFHGAREDLKMSGPEEGMARKAVFAGLLDIESGRLRICQQCGHGLGERRKAQVSQFAGFRGAGRLALRVAIDEDCEHS